VPRWRDRAALITARAVGVPLLAVSSGPWAANAATATPLREVALGDSVTAAHACGCTGFPTRFGRDLTTATGIPVTVDTHGMNGATAADALNASRQPALHAELQSADIVVLTIGANDVEPLVATVPDPARTAATAAWRAQVQAGVPDVSSSVDALLADLDASPRHPQVFVTGYWAVGLDGAVAESAYAPRQAAAQVQLTSEVNDALAVDAARHATPTSIWEPSSTARTGRWTRRRCWPRTETTPARWGTPRSPRRCRRAGSRPCRTGARRAHRRTS
jgi:hypothetical protein